MAGEGERETGEIKKHQRGGAKRKIRERERRRAFGWPSVAGGW